MNFLALLGIGNAYAADVATKATATPQQSILSMLPLFLILICFMYFMIIRPQQKRAKDQKSLIDSIKVGDEVLTSGGIIGKIEKISSDFILLNLGKDININIQKNAIISCVPKGTIKSLE